MTSFCIYWAFSGHPIKVAFVRPISHHRDLDFCIYWAFSGQPIKATFVPGISDHRDFVFALVGLYHSARSIREPICNWVGGRKGDSKQRAYLGRPQSQKVTFGNSC